MHLMSALIGGMMEKKRGRPVSEKTTLSPQRLREAIAFRKTSLRKMDEDNALDLSAKTISRAIKAKRITPDNLERLGQYLNIDIDILSGAYDQVTEDLINKKQISPSSRDRFHIEDHPYVTPEMRKWNWSHLIKYILLYLELPEDSVEKLPGMQEFCFRFDFENAIYQVFHEYFNCPLYQYEYEVKTTENGNISMTSRRILVEEPSK